MQQQQQQQQQQQPPPPRSRMVSFARGDCPICLDSLLADGDDALKWLACGHVFHERCIARWTRDSCPTCRKRVRTLSARHVAAVRSELVAAGTAPAPRAQQPTGSAVSEQRGKRRRKKRTSTRD